MWQNTDFLSTTKGGRHGYHWAVDGENRVCVHDWCRRRDKDVSYNCTQENASANWARCTPVNL